MSSPVRLTGGAYTAHNVIASAQRSLNLYSEPMPQGEGEPAPAANYPTPGTRLLGAVGTGPIRAIRQATGVNAFAYVVSGSTVYEVNPATWIGTPLGDITAGLRTPVSISDNGTNLLIVDGTANGWSITAGVMSPVVDPGGMFVGADRVDYLDTFFLLNKPGTPQFYISGSLALTFDPLDFANKEAYSDLLVTLIVARREVYLLGQKTSEIWYDVGASSPTDTAAFQFAPVQGVFVDHGCVAKYSAASYDNTVFWLSRNRQGRGVVMTSAGYQTKRVSTYAIEAELQTYPRIDDAIGFCYQIAGHTMYVLTFPHADHTWCYDVGTGLWHEWAWIDSNGDEHRHRANAFWPVNDTLVVGDWQNGNLYALDQTAFTDAFSVPSAPPLSLRTSAYHASAVHFDGSTVLSNEALASTDNAYIGVSVWCQADDLSTSPSIFVADPNGNYATFFGLTPLGALISSAANADASSLVQFNTADATLNDTNWHHFIVALRSDDGGIPGQILAAVYMDDIPLVNGGGHPPDPFSTIATNGLLMTIGGDPFGDNFIGNIADLRIMPGINLLDGTGLAISEATRRLFIDADGKPVDPAVATAALGAPCVLFSGPPPALGRSTSFIDNLGTGGAFTLAGTLTEAPTSPSGAAPTPGTPTTVSPIKRVRTYPHLITDARRVFYREFIADMDVGNAPQMVVEEIIPPTLSGFYMLPGGTNAFGYGISADGHVTVGQVDSTACYWVDLTGPTVITPPGSVAWDASHDGSVIVGNLASGSFYWTAADGVVPIDGGASAISADGSIIIGDVPGPGPDFTTQPVYWDRATLTVTALPLPIGCIGGIAISISDNGLFIVGELYFPASVRHAFRWSAADGTIDLGLITGETDSSGQGVSNAGKVVGYFPSSGTAYQRIFVWTPTDGMTTPVDPTLVYGANAISADGTTIGGYSWYPAFDTATIEHFGYVASGTPIIPTPTLHPGAEGTTAYDTNPNTVSADGHAMVGYGGGAWIYYVPTPSRVTIPVASNNLISLRWSDDRGHSYGSLVSQPIGAAGEYRKSLQWQRLGMARDRVLELSWSTPMATALQGAWITAEVADADTPPKEQGE